MKKKESLVKLSRILGLKLFEPSTKLWILIVSIDKLLQSDCSIFVTVELVEDLFHNLFHFNKICTKKRTVNNTLIKIEIKGWEKLVHETKPSLSTFIVLGSIFSWGTENGWVRSPLSTTTTTTTQWHTWKKNVFSWVKTNQETYFLFLPANEEPTLTYLPFHA